MKSSDIVKNIVTRNYKALTTSILVKLMNGKSPSTELIEEFMKRDISRVITTSNIKYVRDAFIKKNIPLEFESITVTNILDVPDDCAFKQMVILPYSDENDKIGFTTVYGFTFSLDKWNENEFFNSSNKETEFIKFLYLTYYDEPTTPELEYMINFAKSHWESHLHKYGLKGIPMIKQFLLNNAIKNNVYVIRDFNFIDWHTQTLEISKCVKDNNSIPIFEKEIKSLNKEINKLKGNDNNDDDDDDDE